MLKPILLLPAYLSLAIAAPVAHASYLLPEWGLAIQVRDASGGGSDSAIFVTVQNPFQESHAVSLASGLKTAEAHYDFWWSEPDDIGSFNIQNTLQAEDTGAFHVAALSNGGILVEPTVDLPISVAAELDFDLPVGALAADLSLTVRDMDTHEIYFFGSQTYNTFTSPPASGTLSTQGGAVLPAGSSVAISYSMSIHGYGASGALATGTGFADFQITPEPSSLSLLLLGALALAKRRRR